MVAVDDIVVFFSEDMPRRPHHRPDRTPSCMAVILAVHGDGVVDLQLGVTPDMFGPPVNGQVKLLKRPTGEVIRSVAHYQPPAKKPRSGWQLIE